MVTSRSSIRLEIFEYLEDLQPDPALWPRATASRARARLLELKSDEVYFPHIIRLMGLQDDPENPAAVAARSGAAACYDELEKLLVGRDYLAGDYSFADIAFYMAQLFGARMGASMTGATPALLRWRDRLTTRPTVMAVVRPMAGFLTARGRPVPDFLASAIPSDSSKQTARQ